MDTHSSPATAPPARYLPGNTGATPEDATTDVSRAVLAPLDGGHTVERFGQSIEIEDSEHVVQPFFQYSRCVGRRKALLVGINYIGTNHPLKGCINDVKNMHKFICDRFGYAKENIVVLTDDTDSADALFPTKANIVKYMSWLVEDVGYDDALYFHYSGHGIQVQDRALDESDHADEAICPLDFEAAGMLRDDETRLSRLTTSHELLVKPLPAGARLTAIFDSCHSGSIMDIPYAYNPEKPPKEPVLSPDGDKSWLSQAIKHNRKLIQQIAEQLAAMATRPPSGPTGPALLRAVNVPADAELGWDKMLLEHRLILVEALKEHALASVEAVQAGADASDQTTGVADEASRSAFSQFIRKNPELVQAVRVAAKQAILQYVGVRGIEHVESEDDRAQNDNGDTDRKLRWGRWRPPRIPGPVITLGEVVATGFGVTPGTVAAGAGVINAVRDIDSNSGSGAPQIPRGPGSDGTDADRSWLSQAIRHNRKTINRIGQVISNAIVDTIAGAVAKDRSIKLMAATGSSPADVICWSGCLDNQKATDTFLNGQAVGAMSYAFVTAMNQNPTQSYMELLKAIRAILKDRYAQIVQLSSSHPINTDLQFIA